MFGLIYSTYNYIRYGNNKNDTKFYYLSLLKDSINNTWHIHGLWPQYSVSSYPTYCKSVEFDVSKLEPIIQELDKYWYATGEKDSQFWEHEYKKHGSCIFTPIDEFTYFNTTLQLYEEALKLNLPDKYYNKNTEKCLIPVDLDFKFINIDEAGLIIC